MKALVRFLLIFTCMKLIVAKPQHLQDQTHYHLDPLNDPQFEYPPKDPGKRTIGPLGRHYAFGKHVGIHPLGFKYVLGYSPINIKYVPVIKPVTVLKPVLQQSIKPSWKPVVTPTRQYLPPILHVPRPVHQIDHGWKPVVPVAPPIHHHKPWADEVQHIHSVVQEPVIKPVEVQPFLPAPLPPVQPVGVKPIVPSLPAHPLHNYFYFQTPVAKPALLPQVPLFHVARPQLPVLPLGATFPAPVLQSGLGVAHIPSGPAGFPFPVSVHPHPAPPVAPVHHPVALHPQPAHHVIHHPIAVHPHPAHPVFHHPAVVHPQPVHPVAAPPVVPAHHPFPIHPHPVSQPAVPVPVHPQHAGFPPISVEFHGNRHLVPFNNQFPFTSIQSSLPLPKNPAQNPPVVIGRQPHALPLPPEVHNQLIPEIQHSLPEQPQVPSVHHQPPLHFQPQAPFNPEAAIQPGQTDLQVPLHLPDHPYFRNHGVNHFQPAGNLEPPFPPFQNPGNTLRPSISLEPPFTHGHS